MAESQGEAAQPKRGGSELFPYHRQLSPMLWVLVALATVEIAALHLLLWHWSRVLTLILGGGSAAALVFLVALILSFRARPVALGETSLRVRVGFLVDADVPLSEIAFAQSGFTPADYMPGALLKASLLAYPNAVVLLRRDIDLPGPFGRLRPVHAVAVAVDEPARFLLAIGARVKHGPASAEGALAAA
jgi:hypothetical protein